MGDPARHLAATCLECWRRGTVTIDFNLAYNPFCAYGDAYSCPLPPIESCLHVPIEAGALGYRKAVP